MTNTKKKRNIYAKSLQNPKYRQRIISNAKKYKRNRKVEDE